MRSIFRRKLTLALLAFLLLVLPMSTSFVSAKGLGHEKREHPRMAKAIKDLQDAVDYMQKAPHDFGGHRAEAVEASQRAIQQLKLALQYDKNHE
ncbi:MAG: hypothetical protein QOJ16_799 [Acidobacteriota bacterium]|jgi:uncharacterized membrane protein YccC|nr:hypothetical protein [Acidobacteriota bacterium]